MYENPKLKDLLFTSAVPCWKSAGELCSCSSESCNPHLPIFFMFLNTCWSFNQSLCSVPWGRNLSHPVWQGALILLNASNKIHTGAAKVSEKGEIHFRKKEQWFCSPQIPGVNSNFCSCPGAGESCVKLWLLVVELIRDVDCCGLIYGGFM